MLLFSIQHQSNIMFTLVVRFNTYYSRFRGLINTLTIIFFLTNIHIYFLNNSKAHYGIRTAFYYVYKYYRYLF